MEHFDRIYQRACERKGGEKALSLLYTKPLGIQRLKQYRDDDWLEEFTRKIFQSGFYWNVINHKWPGFREVFWDFDIEKLLLMPPDMLERKASDERIVRNFTKVQTIPANALMISEAAAIHGSFANMVAQWPSEDITGLWLYLKKHGARLGGNTGAFALRAMGKDTFLLSRDVEGYLRANDIIDGSLHSKKSLVATQQFFNTLAEQSGKSLQEVSKILSLSCGDNVVGMKTA